MGIILMWRQMRINRCRNEAYRISFPRGFTFLLFATLGNLNSFSFVLSLLHKFIVFLLRCYVGPRSNHLFELLFIEVSPALYMLHALINQFFSFYLVFLLLLLLLSFYKALAAEPRRVEGIEFFFSYTNISIRMLLSCHIPSSKDRLMQLH